MRAGERNQKVIAELRQVGYGIVQHGPFARYICELGRTSDRTSLSGIKSGATGERAVKFDRTVKEKKVTRFDEIIAALRQRLDQKADETRERVLTIVNMRPEYEPLPPACPAWIRIEHVPGARRRANLSVWAGIATTAAKRRKKAA